MKHIYLQIVLLMIVVTNSNAQEYQITFSGSGTSSTVDSVLVQNLSSGAKKVVKGGDVLHLDYSTTSMQTLNIDKKEINIYPNPFIDNCIVSFNVVTSGDKIFSVYELSGKKLHSKTFNIKSGVANFRLSGLGQGVFVIAIETDGDVYKGKLISDKDSKNQFQISYIGNNRSSLRKKSANEDVTMSYSLGDRIKYIGYSGNNSTILTDIPEESKIMNFEFIPCVDGDNNSYPTLKIGEDIWMGRNLSTTKYNDGAIIPKVTDTETWRNLQTPAYCWYENDSVTNGLVYGGLYNWFAVNTSTICPSGWHVPSVSEWETLENALGNTSVGAKLRETGTAHWNTGDAEATDEFGFTGLPGGFRYGIDGQFDQKGTSSGYCTSFSDTNDKFWMYMIYTASDLISVNVSKQDGMSIRCVKDK